MKIVTYCDSFLPLFTLPNVTLPLQHFGFNASKYPCFHHCAIALYHTILDFAQAEFLRRDDFGFWIGNADACRKFQKFKCSQIKPKWDQSRSQPVVV